MSTAVIKLGSNIVAREDGEPRMGVLGHVCEEAAELHRQGHDVVLVTSGAIALASGAMGMTGRPTEMAVLQASSAVGQGKLYRLYDELLASSGVDSAQVLLTFPDLSARRQYLNARGTLRTLLSWRVVPVINENDTVATDEISFGDNDFLAAQVAILVDADILLLLTNTEGLYTRDPAEEGAELIREVRDFAEIGELDIGESTSTHGTGGMRSKVVAAEMATAAGIPTAIVNGIRPGAIVRAIAGEDEGTRFHASDRPIASFKLWLKYAKPVRGRVVVDAGAAGALRERGTSLLPVGVVEVEGDFQAGDAVQVQANGSPIGKGIVNYSADELRRIKGLKSGELREVMPRGSEEAVHRDYFVLE
ncbi:MAG: glutamate 5-kinase [Thermoleophilaceae bacterium]|nr:glutamate 5-kinase [Thermoleophilaceae bacterium]